MLSARNTYFKRNQFQQYVIIVNIYASNFGGSDFIQYTIIDINDYILPGTLIKGNFNILPSSLDRSFILKMNK